MKSIIIILSIFLCIQTTKSQCINKDSLWNRIIYLRNSNKVSPENQLKELLTYLNTINKCTYQNDSTHALLLKRIGWLYSLQKDFKAAVYYTSKSIELINTQRRKNNSSVNPKQLISTYWNLRILYDSLKLEKKSSDARDSSILFALNLDAEYAFIDFGLSEKILKFFEDGDYNSCINYANLYESIKNGKQGITFFFDKNVFTWKINSLIFLNKSNEAGNLLKNEIKIAEKNNYTNFLGSLYGLQGSVCRDIGKFSEAINYFKKSYNYKQRFKNNDGCAKALNNIGYVYLDSLRQAKQALPYFNAALKYSTSPDESLNIYDNIANVFAREQNYDSAFFYFQKAFDQIHPGFTESALLNKDNSELEGSIIEYITGTLLDKGDAWLNKFKRTGQQQALSNAINIYKISDKYFDKIRLSQSDIQSQLFWKANNRRLYEHAVEACYAKNDSETAFYFFEKNRSVLLNDQIAQQKKMSNEDLNAKFQLVKKISDIEEKLQRTSTDSKDYSNLEIQLFIQNLNLEKLVKNVNSHLSDNLSNSDTLALTLSQVKKNILDSSKTIVEIFYGDSAVYVLNVNNNNQRFTRINKQYYDSLTRLYTSIIGNNDAINKHYKDFVKVSHQLYNLLFPKLTSSYGSMIISPDGTSYPFEALMINDDENNPDYFLKHYATSYTYSANYLTNQFVANTSNSNSLLGIAPVQYKNNLNLSSLSGSDESLKNINKYFNDGKNYVLDNATKNNFLQTFPDYNIIQLYTHASDESGNGNPVIYFSDSTLYLSNLFVNHTPVTQLVVLSACETANGRMYQGEGIFSFNRGFAALRIPAAVSSLWSVDNKSTYKITELFYKFLSQGLPTDIALQKAKLEFINNSTSEEKKLPYYWAGVILTGKVAVIKSGNTFHWITKLGISVLLLVVGYFIYKIFTKKIGLRIKNNT